MTGDLETELIKLKLRQLEHKMKQLQLASGNENIYKEIQPRQPTHANEQNGNVIDSDLAHMSDSGFWKHAQLEQQLPAKPL